MTVLFVLAGFGVVLAVALLAVGRLGELAPVIPDRAPLDLPEDRPLDRADVDAVRFAVGFRGYRMDEVDDMLDRVAADLAARDARIAALEAVVTPPGHVTAAPREVAAGAAAEPVVTGPAEVVADAPVTDQLDVPEVPAAGTTTAPAKPVVDVPAAPVASGSTPPSAPPVAPWLAAEEGAPGPDPAGAQPDRPAD